MSSLLIVSDYIFDYSKVNLDCKDIEINPNKQSQTLIPLKNIKHLFTTEDEETTINIVGHNDEIITTLVVLGKDQVDNFMNLFAFVNSHHKAHILKVNIKVICTMEDYEVGTEEVSINFDINLIPV